MREIPDPTGGKSEKNCYLCNNTFDGKDYGKGYEE